MSLIIFVLFSLPSLDLRISSNIKVKKWLLPSNAKGLGIHSYVGLIQNIRMHKKKPQTAHNWLTWAHPAHRPRGFSDIWRIAKSWIRSWPARRTRCIFCLPGLGVFVKKNASVEQQTRNHNHPQPVNDVNAKCTKGKLGKLK